MKKMLILSCLVIAAISMSSCTKEPDVAPVDGDLITLSLGFEDQASVDTPEASSSKTFLDGNKKVQWLSGDKTIYVFDTDGQKNTFTTTDGASAHTKNFTGTISENSEISSVIWTGLQKEDFCTFENGIFSGSTLKVVNPQNINNGKSFAQTANIAVMKPGDDVLRNVFGYIKYTIPTVEGGTAGAIKSVTFSATEPLAGLVQIDYTGDVPVASITGEASSQLTVNTRVKNSALEAGDAYAVLPVGTYTNFNIKVTLADDTSFDLPVSEPVIIERSKYTDAGTLPAENPNPPVVEPEEPGDATVWPTDEDAFDYGLVKGQSKVADMSGNEAAGVPNRTGIPESMNYQVTLDKVTYCGAETQFWGGRIATNRAKAFEKISGVEIPTATTQHFFFKINRPGTLSFYPRYSTAKENQEVDGVMTQVSVIKPADVIVAVVTFKGEEKSAKYVFQGQPKTPSTADGDKNNADCRITVEITETDLTGMTQSAEVHVFHKAAVPSFSYYPITWTAN